MFKIDYSDKKPLGKTGEYISAIGLGTWDIKNYSMAKDTFIYAIQLGLNVIDTAEMYCSGRAEEFVGDVIREVGRENVFITTKLMPHNLMDINTAIKAAQSSLRRLGVSYVDLILIHWPESYLAIEKQMRCLETIATKGYARYIGVSNFEVYELNIALRLLKKHEIVANQVKYSVYDKSVERELLPFAIKEGITIQAYTPLERGAVARDKLLNEIGKKYGKSAVQVGLNYLISHEMVTTIPKTERKIRVQEFRGALGWRLNKEDINRLSKYNF